MATNKTNFSLVFLVVLGLVMVVLSVQAKADDHQLKATNLSVYFHHYSAGIRNPNGHPLVGFPGKLWTFTQFGTVYVIDDLVTEGPELTSAKVGRLQGIYYTASLDGLRSSASHSFVFTNKAYNDSTIQILSNVNQFDIGEYGVPSGTGKFRYANGYVTFETISSNLSTSYWLLRANISVRHY